MLGSAADECLVCRSPVAEILLVGSERYRWVLCPHHFSAAVPRGVVDNHDLGRRFQLNCCQAFAQVVARVMVHNGYSDRRHWGHTCTSFNRRTAVNRDQFDAAPWS